jgi:hypothetical protein
VSEAKTAEHSDAELLDLGRELERSWREERDAEINDGLDDNNPRLLAAIAASRAILDCIELLPARTVEGLRVKAMASAWALGCKPPPEAAMLFPLAIVPGGRIIASLIRDLQASAA